VLTFSVMALFFLVTLHALGGAINGHVLAAVLLIWVEMSVMISAAVLFSTLTSPVLASIFSLAFYIAGHFNDLLSLKLVEQKGSLYPLLLKTIYFLLPNLEHFNVRDNVVYGIALPSSYFMYAVLYGVCYTTFFLILSCVLFSKKDL
jgi:hypothetical protein